MTTLSILVLWGFRLLKGMGKVRKEVSNLIAVKGVAKYDLNSNKEREKKNRKGERQRES